MEFQDPKPHLTLGDYLGLSSEALESLNEEAYSVNEGFADKYLGLFNAKWILVAGGHVIMHGLDCERPSGKKLKEMAENRDKKLYLLTPPVQKSRRHDLLELD